jgi:hypothetical protein
LFSPDDSLAAVPANIQATIGNGFIATQMRRYRNAGNISPSQRPTQNLCSPALFIAGVFNGAATTDPSHRALFPAPFNIDIQAADSNYRVDIVASGML